jgi:hypothetical protein
MLSLQKSRSQRTIDTICRKARSIILCSRFFVLWCIPMVEGVLVQRMRIHRCYPIGRQWRVMTPTQAMSSTAIPGSVQVSGRRRTGAADLDTSCGAWSSRLTDLVIIYWTSGTPKTKASWPTIKHLRAGPTIHKLASSLEEALMSGLSARQS